MPLIVTAEKLELKTILIGKLQFAALSLIVLFITLLCLSGKIIFSLGLFAVSLYHLNSAALTGNYLF